LEAMTNETETETVNVWDYLDQAPDYVQETVALYRWGTNYDSYSNPFNVYLDLIGVGMDTIGEPILDKLPVLGYLELCYIADALKEYAEARPQEVYRWLEGLLACDEA